MLEMIIKDKNEIERAVCIINLGILTALEQKLIIIEQAEKYLYSPFSMETLRNLNIRESIIELIHNGCELEDIESLLPEKITDNIQRLKKDTIELLGSLSREEISEEKWFKEE